jgi:DNA repair protein RecO (recombination protein O)
MTDKQNTGRDIRTRAIVLRRTDYGEADRILQLLTPDGKRSVIARGARKEKSRLAGGIELFSVSDVLIHNGRGELGILTGARLLEYYDGLVKDLDLIEQGGELMRAVNARAEHVDSPDFFDIVQQSFRAMQKRVEEGSGRWKDVLRAWWGLNLVKASGEDVNLSFDANGDKLVADGRYYWDEESVALMPAKAGRVNAEHIKLMRIMQTGQAELALKVKGADDLIDEILYIVKCVERSTKI